MLREGFDRVFVIDDASTDDTLDKLAQFGDKIQVIKGDRNLGPAGNRNRVIKFLQSGDTLVFIDADMELVSHGLRPVIEGLMVTHPHVALFGGGILNKSSKPMYFNYGVQTSKLNDAIGITLQRIGGALHFKWLAWPIMQIARRYTRNLDIRYSKPHEQRVDWVSEGHCYLRGDVFTSVGGFDPQLHYSEGKELAWRIRHAGWGVMFVPRIWTRHLELKVRDKDENTLRQEAAPVIEQKVKMMLRSYESDDVDPKDYE
jgi:N-acetylglucosaminyl-diphospho-decaprenol L-rhamnosyltransferase